MVANTEEKHASPRPVLIRELLPKVKLPLTKKPSPELYKYVSELEKEGDVAQSDEEEQNDALVGYIK